MKSWRQIKLKDICERITVGHVGSMSNEYIDEGIPFLRSQNINPYRINRNGLKFVSKQFHESLRKSALRFGDVAVVRTGYPGTACVIPKDLGEANCSDLVIITPGLEVNAYFLSAVFNSRFGKDLVGGNLVGAAQQHFNVTTAKELKIFLPPKTAQDKIAAVLSAYDDLIETNKKRIEILEKMAEELYREWFVRMRFPGHKNTKFLKGLPDNWQEKRVRDIVNRRRFGRIYRESELSSEGSVIVIDQSRADYLGFYNGAPEHEASEEKPMILFGDHSCKMVFMTRNFSLAENVIPFSPQDEMPAYFLFHMIKDLAKTTEYKRHWTELTNREVLVPELDLQKKFSEIIKTNHSLIQQYSAANSVLVKTRDLLLPRLISGKLSVEDLDIQFPPSMKEEEEPEIAHA